MIVQAYKATDGKLFEDEAEYNAHCRHLTNIRRQATRVKNIELKRQAAIQSIVNSPSTIDELCDAVMANWDVITKSTPLNGSKLESLSFTEMKFSNSVSNTHSCPASGVTNWGSQKDKPNGYPGWYGRIHIRTADADLFYMSDAFRSLRIHTGTGGGGHYEVKLFADDFHGLAKVKMWEQLSNL